MGENYCFITSMCVTILLPTELWFTLQKYEFQQNQWKKREMCTRETENCTSHIDSTRVIKTVEIKLLNHHRNLFGMNLFRAENHGQNLTRVFTNENLKSKIAPLQERHKTVSIEFCACRKWIWLAYEKDFDSRKWIYSRYFSHGLAVDSD